MHASLNRWTFPIHNVTLLFFFNVIFLLQIEHVSNGLRDFSIIMYFNMGCLTSRSLCARRVYSHVELFSLLHNMFYRENSI
jgi:hypothetical protein